MFKKLLSLLLAAMLALSLVSAAFADDKTVTISYYSTQAGVDDATRKVLDAFEAQHPGIKVEYYPCGDDQLAAWLGLYNAGTAPTVSMLDVGQILQYSDYMYNFNDGDTEWMSHVLSGFDFCQKAGDDAIYGIPSSYQGFGLLYNKDLVAQVYGADFDVATVNTRDKLVEFFDGFEKAGIPATIVFSADWAVGAHYLACQLISEWQGDKATQRAVLQGLKDGEVKLMENEVFNNVMDTFDILMKYNMNKADPLADLQENDCIALGTGKAATMFQGDWNWLFLGKIPDGERNDLGIMGLPLTNDESDPRNGKIYGSVPKAYCVDAYQNTPEQQAAGKELAIWLALSPENQQFMVDEVGSTLPFDNATAVNANPLAVDTKKALDNGSMLDIQVGLCEGPSDFWLVCGPYMQAYLAGHMDRTTLAAEIEAYYTELE